MINLKKNGMMYLCIGMLCGCAASGASINELPMYGGITKTKQMKEADERFIKTIEQQMTKEEGANQMVDAGWAYLEKNDPLMAIKRFNQAWLLNPNSADVYWGFAATLGMQNKTDDSIKMFEEAFRHAPTNPRIYYDAAMTYGRKVQELRETPTVAEPYILKAIQHLEKMVAETPEFLQSYEHLAYFNHIMENDNATRKWLKELHSRGGKIQNPDIAAFLASVEESP